VFGFALDRPVKGWGFMAAWTQSELLEELAAQGRLVFEAHSGYLEVLLGVGLLGLVPLFALLTLVTLRALRAVFRAPSLETAMAAGFVLYALFVNVTETYIGANLLPWLLMSIVAAQSSVRPR
jgi:exopolysaccharide production protein ExoQ